MTARTRWLLAIVGLLVGNVIAMVVLATCSASGGSRVVDGYDNQRSLPAVIERAVRPR